MNIQLAQEQHIDSIMILYRQLIASMVELQPFFFKSAEQSKDFMKAVITDENSDILIVLKDDKVLGLALIQEKSSLPYNMFKSHQYAYLMDLVVDSSVRKQGLGSALITACKAWANKRNLDYLELNVFTNNSDALKLYKKQQFQERIKTMYVAL